MLVSSVGDRPADADSNWICIKIDQEDQLKLTDSDTANKVFGIDNYVIKYSMIAQ